MNVSEEDYEAIIYRFALISSVAPVKREVNVPDNIFVLYNDKIL